MSTVTHTATYTVAGMTCGHCVSSVTEEVGEITGVTGVAVDLPSGAVTVTAEGEITESVEAAVRAAVREAGYQVTDTTGDAGSTGSTGNTGS